MPLWAVAALAVAGGFGAVARYVVDTLVTTRVAHFPLGTLAVNLSGSLVLGFVVGLGAGVLPAQWHAVLGVGFLGGYTTFSTASFETVKLALDGRRGAAVGYGLGMLLGAVLAASLGLWLGGLV